MESAVPLNYEASAGDTHRQTTEALPGEVVNCLKNARFMHFATCHDNIPHISLMNYTYLPTSPYSSGPVIVMTTNPSSKKINNLLANPNVSLLVHDWSSHRSLSSRRPSVNPTAAGTAGSPSPPPEPPRSSLASLLMNLNSAAISSISATITGTARLLDRGSGEETFFREQHMKNNFDDQGPLDLGGNNGGSGSPMSEDPPVMNGAGRHNGPHVVPSVQAEDGGRGCFIAGEEVRVIVVAIRDVRTSDYKGSVRDWTITGGAG